MERDISSDATEGLPDLHSPARTPFCLSRLFITVLAGTGLLSQLGLQTQEQKPRAWALQDQRSPLGGRGCFSTLPFFLGLWD
jgi:hypothetical protein